MGFEAKKQQLEVAKAEQSRLRREAETLLSRAGELGVSEELRSLHRRVANCLSTSLAQELPELHAKLCDYTVSLRPYERYSVRGQAFMEYPIQIPGMMRSDEEKSIPVPGSTEWSYTSPSNIYLSNQVEKISGEVLVHRSTGDGQILGGKEGLESPWLSFIAEFDGKAVTWSVDRSNFNSQDLDRAWEHQYIRITDEVIETWLVVLAELDHKTLRFRDVPAKTRLPKNSGGGGTSGGCLILLGIPVLGWAAWAASHWLLR
jgi:hypothetical protein